MMVAAFNLLTLAIPFLFIATANPTAFTPYSLPTSLGEKLDDSN